MLSFIICADGFVVVPVDVADLLFGREITVHLYD